MNYLYLLLDLFTISVPLLRSFEPKVNYSSNFKSLFTAIAITGFVFIVWDIIFTAMGIWGFNPRYLVGLSIFGLPIEEWLFFVAVPFASIFIYEVINYFFPRDHLKSSQKVITIVMAMILIIIGGLNYDKWYTVITFLSTGLFLLYLNYIAKVSWLGKFYRAFLIVLFPFFLVNGVLTGTGIEEQIVWYNDNENLGIRLFTIPIEDTFYGMLLLLINVYILEKLRPKKTE